MYKNKLRKRGDINSANITRVFTATNHNNSLNYFENLKKELETRKARFGRMLFRRKLQEHQDKVNYTNEIQRLRGELSRNDTRLPDGTIDTLKARIAKLKDLGGQIVHEIK